MLNIALLAHAKGHRAGEKEKRVSPCILEEQALFLYAGGSL